MDLVYNSTPYLSLEGALTSQLLLLHFLNQLRTHNNVTTQHTVQAVQNCLHSLREQEKHRKQLTNRQQEDYSKLSADYLNLQNLHLSAAKRIQDLEDSLKESSKNCEERISALERQVEKENLTRIVCESEAKLQKAYSQLQQLNKELHEMKNCSQGNDGKIDQVLATLQIIYQNLINGKDTYVFSAIKESLENFTEMCTRQSRELEDERKKTQGLEQQNRQLETSLCNMEKQQQEHNQKFQAELQTMTEELQKKGEELKTKDQELRRKDEQLIKDEQVKTKDEELAKMDEELKKKDQELAKMDKELKKKDEQMKKKDEELAKMDKELKKKDQELAKMDKELKKKDEELKKKDEALRTKDELIDQREKKVQEIQSQLKSCNQLLDAAKKQTNVTKAIEFTNKYSKYLASGNFNFAIAVYGDTEIKDVFQPSEGIFGTQMTNQEAHEKGFSCGNGRYVPNCFKCDGIDDCGNRNDESNCSTAAFPLGARVVRGPGWKWDNQDGDPPGVGTVIDETYPQYEGWNKVQWDNGHVDGYRVGAEGKIDLRAAAGYFCGAT